MVAVDLMFQDLEAAYSRFERGVGGGVVVAMLCDWI
jgi:hypothetical protein